MPERVDFPLNGNFRKLRVIAPDKVPIERVEHHWPHTIWAEMF